MTFINVKYFITATWNPFVIFVSLNIHVIAMSLDICKCSGCYNHVERMPHIAFYHFPKNEHRQQQWVLASGAGRATHNNVICELHFTEDSFKPQCPGQKRVLKTTAVPNSRLTSDQQAQPMPAKRRREEEADSPPGIVDCPERLCQKKIAILQKQVNDLEERNRILQQDLTMRGMTETARSRNLRELRIKRMEKQLEQKNKDLVCHQSIIKRYEGCFTVGQNHSIKTGKRPKEWVDEDVSWAMTLYMASNRAYNLIRTKMPLPCRSTIKERASRIRIEPGFLRPILPLLEKMTDPIERVCIASFDEMKVKEKMEFDFFKKRVVPIAKYVQVMLLHGFYKDWKHVVYYEFDQPMTPHIFLGLIGRIEEAGLVPVAAVSDLGTSNQKLRRLLGVTQEFPCILTPNGNNLTFFADVPHLLKIVRGHFLHYGFQYGQETITVDAVRVLHAVQQKSELKYAPNLRAEHLQVKGPRAQKVKLAAQLLSNKVASGIRELCTTDAFRGIMPRNSNVSADFIDCVNQWFDLFNVSRAHMDSRPTRRGFGLNIEEQEKVLDAMAMFISGIRSLKHGKWLPFQSAILANNNALKIFYAQMKTDYGMVYVITRRLNQDPLELFFGIIRCKGGGLYDHPTALTFMYRLRASILGNCLSNRVYFYVINFLIISIGRRDANQQLANYSNIEQCEDSTGYGKWEIAYESMDGDNGDGQNYLPPYCCEEYNCNLNEAVVGVPVLQYIGGFIMKKLDINCEGGHSKWISGVSKGGLKTPNNEFNRRITQLEDVFLQLNRCKGIYGGPDFECIHLKASEHVQMDISIKKLFFKVRLFARIRHINDEYAREKAIKAQMTRERNKKRAAEEAFDPLDIEDQHLSKKYMRMTT